MAFDVPLFVFGLFVTLLVAIGGVLAIAELRGAHAPQRREETDGRGADASKPLRGA